MEKPETFIAGIAVGGLLLGAGYVAGRASVSAPKPRAEASASEKHAPPSREPGRRNRPKPARPDTKVIVGITAASAQPPAGATIEAGEDLAVHADPDATSPVSGTVARGARVHVLDVRPNGWTVVSRPDDSTFALGWVLWGRPAPAAHRGAGVLGTATLHGVVRFTGHAPVMAVPRKRTTSDYCKDKAVPFNAVVVHGDKLQDVFVRLANDAALGHYDPPAEHVVVDQVDCMVAPRIVGAIAGQTIDIRNGDRTLHDVHLWKGAESWINQPHIAGAPAIQRPLPDAPGLVKLTCDVHPWERGFVVVSAHPFFAVSGADGSFKIERVPAGRFTVEAWHPRYGLKTAAAEIAEGGEVKVDFSYDGTEPEPSENRDEMKDLF